jgi:hypothetical protein
VRSDLPVPQQIVQSCHAAIEVAKSLLPADLPHPHLVVCPVAGERQLFALVNRLRRSGIEYRAFHEPDRGGPSNPASHRR